MEVVVKRVAGTVPEEAARQLHFKLDQPAPVATLQELADYDAIIVGSGTRYGGTTPQMRAFQDQTGSLRASGALTGTVGPAFANSTTQHGGNETAMIAAFSALMHMGMV